MLFILNRIDIPEAPVLKAEIGSRHVERLNFKFSWTYPRFLNEASEQTEKPGCPDCLFI
jgi:hypothetical protein